MKKTLNKYVEGRGGAIREEIVSKRRSRGVEKLQKEVEIRKKEGE